MSIYKGSTEISNLYLGTKEIEYVYKGTTEVWANYKLIDLGTASSFNVASVYSKYADLTADNFYVVSSSSNSYSQRCTAAQEQGWWIYCGAFTDVIKSYDATTGVLTCYKQERYGYRHDSHSYGVATANCRVYLITKPDKLYHLGSGQTFDVATALPSLYQSLTADDFMIKTGTTCGIEQRFWGSSEYSYTVTIAGNGTIEKSYNASTGALTFRTMNYIADQTFYVESLKGTRYGNCDVYVNVK